MKLYRCMSVEEYMLLQNGEILSRNKYDEFRGATSGQGFSFLKEKVQILNLGNWDLPQEGNMTSKLLAEKRISYDDLKMLLNTFKELQEDDIQFGSFRFDPLGITLQFGYDKYGDFSFKDENGKWFGSTYESFAIYEYSGGESDFVMSDENIILVEFEADDNVPLRSEIGSYANGIKEEFYIDEYSMNNFKPIRCIYGIQRIDGIGEDSPTWEDFKIFDNQVELLNHINSSISNNDNGFRLSKLRKLINNYMPNRDEYDDYDR